MGELVAGLLGILVGFIVLIVLFVKVIHNKLVHLRNTVQSLWSDIDVRLKKRYDLVSDLLEAMKGYAAGEQSMFAEVSEARSVAMQASSPREKATAEDAFSGALKSLLAAAEAYPELKANENFIQLESRLKELAQEIESAERSYNSSVRDLNNLIGSFPSNMIASGFGFGKEDFFGTDPSERRPVNY